MPGIPDELARKRRVVAGMVIALVGAALFWLNLAEGPSNAVITAALGAAFVAGYFYNKSYGLLIPGCILLGLGLGELADREWFYFHEMKRFGLGIGFIAIYVIDRLYRGESSWWPLIPGLILAGGVVINEVDGFQAAFEKGWPLILVVIGFALIMGFGRRSDRDKSPPRPEEPKPPHEI